MGSIIGSGTKGAFPSILHRIDQNPSVLYLRLEALTVQVSEDSWLGLKGIIAIKRVRKELNQAEEKAFLAIRKCVIIR